MVDKLKTNWIASKPLKETQLSKINEYLTIIIPTKATVFRARL